jgi:hypothetical protein
MVTYLYIREKKKKKKADLYIWTKGYSARKPFSVEHGLARLALALPYQ